MCSTTIDNKVKEAQQYYLKGKDGFIDAWTELRIEIAKDKLVEIKEKLAEAKKLLPKEHTEIKKLEIIEKRLTEIAGQ